LSIHKNKPSSQLALDKPATRFGPTVETVNGIELIWQIPGSARSVLFLAHGCNGKAANFWDKSLSCEHCVGLPEERAIVGEALDQKFAVVAVTSKGKCWSMKETMVVERVIKWWVEKRNLEKLPVVALGASSGGYFVSMLASKMRFSSIVVMIAEGVFENIDATKDYPPTLFVHMPKDKRRKRLIDANVGVLRNQGVDVAEVECLELPLTHRFLADRVPGLGLKVSAELFGLFKEKGFVDEKGYLVRDGRALPWKEAASERKVSLRNEILVSYIQEELNLAFAYHEMTSLQSEQMFNWFESHLR
ncbi:uncharacterized protein LOC143560622, partial [Bidens hawaiensis]|uniref:uncharacterized protein LOC143560622 n=1 Tax=Bidens hawaiensis TaxID=980011 RepID=UPI00404AA4CC